MVKSWTLIALYSMVIAALFLTEAAPRARAQIESDRTIDVAEGWNLLGWLGPDTEIDAFVADVPPEVASVFVFDAGAGRFESYARAVPAFLNTLDSVSINSGIWVLATGSTSWLMPAIAESRSVNLRAGLNLVTWTAGNDVPLEDAVAPLGDAFQAAFRFDAATQRFQSFRTGQLPLLNTFTTVANGDALWISVSRDLNWSQIPAGSDAIRATVTAEGAALDHPDGFQLTIPAGALRDGTAVSVFTAASPTPPAGIEPVGLAWEVAASANLDAPVTVRLPRPPDLEAERAGVARLTGDGTVEFLPATVIDDVLEVEVAGFSRFFAARGSVGVRPEIIGPTTIVFSGEPGLPGFVSNPGTYQVTAVEATRLGDVTYQWQADDFGIQVLGDGTGREVQVVGVQTGISHLTVTATDRRLQGFGGVYQAHFAIEVVRAANAEVLALNLTGNTRLTGTELAQIDGVVLGGSGQFSVLVEWGDESFDEIPFTGPEFRLPVHNYEEIGIYAARVTVTDSAGAKVSSEVLIDVATEVVRGRIEVDVDLDRGDREEIGVWVSGAQDEVDVTIQFGDGESTRTSVLLGQFQRTGLAFVVHQYREPGTYVISATVVADNGASTSVSQQVVVWPDGLRRDAFTGNWDSRDLPNGRCQENDTPAFRWAVDLSVDSDGHFAGRASFHACPGGGAAVYEFFEPDIASTTRAGLRFEELPGASNWAVIVPADRLSARGTMSGIAGRQQDFQLQRGEPPSPNLAP